MPLTDVIKAVEATLARITRKVDGFKGDGVTNTPTSLSIQWPRYASNSSGGVGGPEGFWARIGSTPVRDTPKYRWTYDFSEVYKHTAGYGGWADKSGGITGTCYNSTEDVNGASGLFGNGVDAANLVGSFAVQPIPPAVPIWVWVVRLPDGTPEYWTSFENGIDGTCP